MRTANTVKRHFSKFFMWGAALALAGCLWPREAQGRLYTNYTDFAQANDWVTIEIDDDDPTDIKTNLVWESGYQKTDDKDGDGLTNLQEFQGWQATINGYTN